MEKRTASTTYPWVCFLPCRAGSWPRPGRRPWWRRSWGATQSWDHRCTGPDLEKPWWRHKVCMEPIGGALKKKKKPTTVSHSPTLVLSMPMSKAPTRFSRNIRTSRKLSRPMLQEPSTRITMSATASVRHTNWSAVSTTGKSECDVLILPIRVKIKWILLVWQHILHGKRLEFNFWCTGQKSLKKFTTQIWGGI